MNNPLAFIKNLRHVPVLFIFITIHFFAYQCYAQSIEKDSLLTLIPTELSDSAKVDLLNELAWVMRRDASDSAEIFALEALNLAQETGLLKQQATAYNRLGEIKRLAGDETDAAVYFESALEIERLLKHQFGIARAQSMLCVVYRSQDKFEESLEAGRESLSLFIQLELRPSVARAYHRLASTYLEIGQYDSVILMLEKKMRLNTGNAADQANTNWTLGLAYYNLGDFEKSKELYLLSESFWKETDNQWMLARLSGNLGNVTWRLGDEVEAIRINEAGISLYEKIGSPLLAADNFLNLGNMAFSRGEAAQAKRYFEKAIRQKQESQVRQKLNLALYNLGVVHRKMGDLDSALLLFKIVEQENKKEPLLMEVYWNLSEVYFSKGDFKQSNHYRKLYGQLRDRRDQIMTSSLRVKESLESSKQKQDLLVKDNQIKSSELQRRSQLIFFLSVTILLLIILFFFALQFYRTRKNTVIYEQKVDDLIKSQEIKKLGAELEGRDEERKRIAKELHDRLGGMLSMVKLHFKTVEDQIQNLKHQNKEQYELANQLLDEACEEVRKISHDMISGVLYKFGLLQALRSLADSINQTGQLSVQFIPSGMQQNLGEEREMHIYRIVQELLANVLKHAKATEVTIQLIHKNNNLRLQVDDNGIGFDLNTSDTGIGLKNVEARVDSLQGEHTIESNKSGTIVTIDIPLN